MKKLLYWIVFLLIGTTLQQCTDEESIGPEKVQFTFSLSSVSNEGGKVQWTELPQSLLLSVQNNANVPVFTLREIKLLRIGESFMTEPLELTQGYYKITDFLLVDDSAKVLYATPKYGSVLAKAVVHPLPYGFNVYKNKVTNVEMEVIDVQQQLPEEFGYASFSINSVNPIQLSVFIRTGTITTLTSANAYIVHTNDTIKKSTLIAGINMISFAGNPQDEYRLIVSKSGYNPYVNDFVYAELINSLNNLPLKVYLEPATFTMLAFTDGYGGTTYAFDFAVGMTEGSIIVDWGDGTSSTGTSHIYAAAGTYLVTVSGDLDKITDFYSFYGQGRMDAINVSGLTEVVDFRFGLTPRTPKVIDLSNNKKLEFVMLTDLVQMERLILPVEAPMWLVDISGPNQLSVAAIDEIVNAVYQSAVLHSEQSGRFLLYANWTDASTPQAPHPMVGPPSAEALTQLRALRDTYGWSIAPNPE